MASLLSREGDPGNDPGTVTGRVVVPAGLRIPPTESQAPVWDTAIATTTPRPAFWLLGAHDTAAGVATLTRTWAPAGDSRMGWPAADRYRSVVIVARTHREGLQSAHDLLLQSIAGLTGGCSLLGLVSVPDAPGKLPATLRRQRGVVESAAPRVWRLPYLPHYRTLTYKQMPVWSPNDPTPPPGSKLRRADPTEYPDPKLVEVGAEIFDAARLAATRQAP
ncbi:hypothetical protein CBI38_37310 (plasmid) [Rhodococcus oxybenzonivorans]|uniref:Uncharacterized protein n=1 Tax=Rhodococcus oxybenzonivorans TaxID=1990687 RepID=A0A2S2C850_9NOCA|nr:hypothetical protein [Rhodococcus oxybenzonivorans]AWK77047.1 hypothetical protein CBI38_37310 [Rhodococcus oxybenzonivorans]